MAKSKTNKKAKDLRVPVACAICRKRVFVRPSGVNSVVCCGQAMSQAAGTAKVAIECTRCRRGGSRLWSDGPSYACDACGTDRLRVTGPDIRIPGRPKKKKEPAAAGTKRGTTENTVQAEVQGVAEHVATFLQVAGIEVSVVGDDLELNGQRISLRVLSGQRVEQRTLNAVVARHFSDRLLKAAQASLEHPRGGLELRQQPKSPVVEVRYRSKNVAFVSAAGWTSPSTERSGVGNFLTSGTHWEELRVLTGLEPAEGLETDTASKGEAEVSTPKAPRPPIRDGVGFVHYDFPVNLSTEVQDLAEAASSKIRTGRSLAFGHAVHMRGASGFELTFSPIAAPRGRPEVEVVFVEEAVAQSFRMRVSAIGDPLPVWAPEATTEDDRLTRGWALALVAFAELTCPPTLDHLRAPKGTSDGNRRASSAAPGRSGVASRSTDPERRMSREPSRRRRTLEPTGETARWLASYVAGHRRKLQAGQEASASATANAATVGIALRSGETWVSPHTRGMPPGIRLHFGWNAPKAFSDLRADTVARTRRERA